MKKIIRNSILFSLLCVTFIKIEPFGDWGKLENTTVEDFHNNEELRKDIISRYNQINDEDRANLSRNKEGKKRLDLIDKIGKKAKKAQDILDHNKRVNDYKDGDKSNLRDMHRSFFGHLLFGDGAWGDRWNQFNAAREAQNQIEKRQKEIKEKDPSLMGENFIKTLKPYEIEVLQPSQIKNFCKNVFRNESNKPESYKKIQAFTPDQIKLFNKGQIQALDLNNLTNDQIKALTPEQISWFTPKQVGLWTEGLIKDPFKSLTINQLQELNINKLSNVQIGYLTKKDISNLKLQQIKDIKSLSAFSAQQIEWILSRPDTQLSEGQILSISTEKLNQLDRGYLQEILARAPKTPKTVAKLKDIQEILNSNFRNS